MCQRLYIATRTELTPIRKRKDAPYLGIRPHEEARTAFRQASPAAEFPYVYAAEAFAPCGCGFPEALEGKESCKVEPEAMLTMRRLVEALRPVVTSRPRVRLLLSFLGDEDEPTSGERTISLDELQSPGFRFDHHEILTVLKEPQNNRMQQTGSAPAWNRGPRS